MSEDSFFKSLESLDSDSVDDPDWTGESSPPISRSQASLRHDNTIHKDKGKKMANEEGVPLKQDMIALKDHDHTRKTPPQVNLDRDHTGERPYHSDDLDCDFEDFEGLQESDSHTIPIASMLGETTNLDYSSDATTVSYNTLDLEAVYWSSADEMDSMDLLEREKMFERVFAG